MLRRLLIISVALLVALIASVALAFTKTWDSPQLGQRILDQIGASTGMRIEAEEFRLSLRHGLRLGKVHAEAQLPAGRMVLDADAMVLEHQLGPLLNRQIHLDRVRLERPHVVLREAAASEAEPAPTDAGKATETPAQPGEAARPADKGFSAQVREIALVDATLESRPADPAVPPIVVEGFDLTLRDLELGDTHRLMTSLRGMGDLRVRRIDAAGREVTDAEGVLRLEDGQLVVEDMSFDVVDGGRMTVPRFSVQLDHEDLLFDLELRGALDVEGLLGVSERLVGGADLVFEGSGPLTDIMAVAGTGRVEVKEGKLPAAKIFRLIDGLLGESVLVGAQYGLFNVAYRLQDQKVELDAFDIGTRNVGLTISGEASLDGTITMLLDVRVPRTMISIKEIPEQALDVLEDEQGRVQLPFQIGGDSVDPTVVLARSAVLQAARQGAKREVKERAQEEIGKVLRGLFSKGRGKG